MLGRALVAGAALGQESGGGAPQLSNSSTSVLPCWSQPAPREGQGSWRAAAVPEAPSGGAKRGRRLPSPLLATAWENQAWGQ